MAIEAELQAQVDAQLMEQGVFAPLDLLFNSGRLIYSDYEAWRRREMELLDDVLMGDRGKILAELERAAAYARSIGLVEQAQEFFAWGRESVGAGAEARTGVGVGAVNRPLRISAEPRLQRLIGCRYLPAQSAPQMDLFFDNPVVTLTNGIARALCARNAAEGQRQLDRLYVQAPNHPDLAAFDRLVGGLDDLGRPVDNPAERLAFLDAIAPTARHLLGPGSRDYLSPLWRHLADALAGRPFSPEEPNLHRSFALSQAHDWNGVSESIVGDAAWWLHPALCLRLADSAFRRRRRVEALAAWCYLCWVAPDQVAAAVERLRQADLSVLWQAFLDCEEDAAPSGAPGPTLIASDFPAWLLLREPGLARQLSVDLARGSSPAEERYRCVHRWIHAHRAHRQEEEMALRRSLQQSHPVLFAVLKRSVGAK
ncbi:MAG: hypothetical protein JWO04_2023 [Gammaproteobacteria bacterium]|nr:hypothetical protein [Gammaproteobacteria bacterium]